MDAAVAKGPLLAVKNIEVIYDHVILVLRGVSLEVPQGGIVALLGGNGAGKSTTLKSVSTLLAAERGAVTKGSIEFRGRRTDKLTPGDLVAMGMVQVMEGRRCFAHLTVEENLITGAYSRPIKGAELQAALDRVYAYFPRLKERRTSLAGYTSGGEQQMTAIGRAMMAKPSMLLLDEPSMGLAPQILAEIFEIVRDLNQKEGVSILLAEQNTNVALKFADYGYILENGRIVLDGPARALAENKDVKEFYLGISAEGRRSQQRVAFGPMDGFDQHEASRERDEGEEVALSLLAAEQQSIEAFQLAYSDLARCRNLRVRCAGREGVIRIAGRREAGAAERQQIFHLLHRVRDHAGRLAGLELALQLDEGMIGAIETARQNRRDV